MNNGPSAHPAATASREVLLARAAALAREPVEAEAAGGVEVVEFVLARERYAIEGRRVGEVYPLRDLTPVPCTPAFVLGIVNVRGQILAVIDLRALFDLPTAGLTELNKLLILHHGDVRVGVLADAVTGVRTLRPREVRPPLPTLTGVRAEYLRGVTDDGVVFLDAERLLASDRFVVDEEVGP